MRMCSLLAAAAVMSGCADRIVRPITSPGQTPDPADAAGPTLALPDGGAMAGRDPTCVSQTVRTQRTPVDLLFLVDLGPTIHEPFAGGSESKFLEARKAMLEFVMDPGSAGLGIGLQFFPYGYVDKPCFGFRDCGQDTEVLKGTTNYVCVQSRVCTLDGQPPGTMLDCPGQFGAPGACDCSNFDYCSRLSVAMGRPTTCTEVGECSLSKGPCYELGKPCPNAAHGMCTSPLGHCNHPGPSCDPTMYETPAVPIADLPAGAQPFLDALNLTDVQAGYNWPLAAAVKGSLAYLRKRAATPGARPGVLVLVTEGKQAQVRASCSPTDFMGALPELESAARGTPGLPAYVLGVLSEADRQTGRENLNRLATAGGTTSPIVIDSAENVVPRLLEGLEKVRHLALPCELTIPAPQAGAGALDYGKVNLTITSNGMTREIGHAGRAEDCRPDKGGWHYDADPRQGKPTRIRLCPATCDALKGDTKAKADLVIGCVTRPID